MARSSHQTVTQDGTEPGADGCPAGLTRLPQLSRKNVSQTIANLLASTPLIYAQKTHLPVLFWPLEYQRRSGPLRAARAPGRPLRLETRPTQKARLRCHDVSR